MLRRLFTVCMLGLLTMSSSLFAEDAKMAGPLSFKMTGLDGKDVDLASFKGKVVLFVNVASRCGYTKQYTGLQALHDKYNGQGLVIIGVPANDFGKQEPGTDAEIAEFCSAKYNVTFTMLSKVPTIVGDQKVDLYKVLTTDEKSKGEVKWNFTKFLIGRDGKVAARFEPAATPEGKEMVSAIEAELAKK
jgi:glutathione peroxidase